MKSYKDCHTAAELNAYTKEERDTCCWNNVKKNGVYFSTQYGFKNFFTQTREKTVRNNLEGE